MLEHFSLLFELLIYGTVSSVLQLIELSSHHSLLLNERLIDFTAFLLCYNDLYVFFCVLLSSLGL